MLKKRVEQLEEESQNQNTEYKSFNEFYNDSSGFDAFYDPLPNKEENEAMKK